MPRPYVLSIAGFDPSAGAGILSDVKTFESLDVYGLGVCSALTYQNDILFDGIAWIPVENIISQIEILRKRFDFDFIKIGLIESLQNMSIIVDVLKSGNSNSKIIWDPILEASAGFEFHKEMDQELIKKICSSIYLVTPNWMEIKKLTGCKEEFEGAAQLSKYCNVFLKGGHSKDKNAIDILISNGSQHRYEQERIIDGSKHGSGCVLSSAIASELAKGQTLIKACELGKNYVTAFLKSSEGLLGFHNKKLK